MKLFEAFMVGTRAYNLKEEAFVLWHPITLVVLVLMLVWTLLKSIVNGLLFLYPKYVEEGLSGTCFTFNFSRNAKESTGGESRAEAA